MTSVDPRAIVRFIEIATRLKTLRRQGWIDRGVEDPESVADHSWAVALLSMLLAEDRDDIDAGRVLLLALVHDLPESLVGDETPFDHYRGAEGTIPPEHFRRPPEYDLARAAAKHAREREALDLMVAGLPAHLAGLVHDAWREYAEGASPEARFIKQIDKLETLIQAERYRMEQPGITIESFRSGTERDVTDRALRAIVREILAGSEDAGQLTDEEDHE